MKISTGILGWLGALALAGGLAAQAAEPAPQGNAGETKEQRDARMSWWREAKFGMFIHWGVYSVPAGTYDGKQIGGIGEWIMNRGKIPVARYAEYAKEFNPVKFNADEWVAVAKAAGMKYIVITSKHHDGFAMFHSKASPYNIHDATPFKRDPLAELAVACRKQGMKLGFYYSQNQDWHHPGGGASGGHWDKAQDGDYSKYIDEIAVPQVREILGNYGEFPVVLWWDTPGQISAEDAAKLNKVAHELKPGIIMNNRLGGGFKGDTETPEQHIPATGYPGRDWETCMTMNGTWGFKSYDDNWKSVETLLRNLCDIASKGGNYLLNVGPTSEGVIPAPSVERLAAVGKWMQVNGEAVYGSSASPFKRLAWGRCTQKAGKLYLHVFDWPKDGKLLVPVLNQPGKAWLLAAPGTMLTAKAGEEGITVEVPAAAPDPIASVVALEIEGAPRLAPDGLPQEKDGTLRLDAGEAEILGTKAKLEGRKEQHIGFWVNQEDFVRWPVRITAPGKFNVAMKYACEEKAAGSEFALSIGDQSLAGKVESTGAWTNFVSRKIGTIAADKPGVTAVVLKPTKKGRSGVMNLRGLVLTPAAR